MTSWAKRPSPETLTLDYARAELLAMALVDQKLSLRRTLRLQEANPHPTAEEKYEIEQVKHQLSLCNDLHREVTEMESRLKE